MWAARPHLASIFEKLLEQKTFGCLRLIIGNLVSRNTTRMRFGKAGAHPQLAWESQLPLKPYLSLQPSDFEGNCDFFDFFLDFCFISLCSLICSANVGCSPTPRQHFWKIVGSKNFYFACGLLLGIPSESGSARLGYIPSLPGNRNCPWNLISYCNLSLLKAIAILSILS